MLRSFIISYYTEQLAKIFLITLNNAFLPFNTGPLGSFKLIIACSLFWLSQQRTAVYKASYAFPWALLRNNTYQKIFQEVLAEHTQPFLPV